METQSDDFTSGENNPDQEMKQRFEIENDEDTLEPFDDGTEYREINATDPEDLEYWANEFQVSVADLKAAIVLNGNSVREIKKYLSI